LRAGLGDDCCVATVNEATVDESLMERQRMDRIPGRVSHP